MPVLTAAPMAGAPRERIAALDLLRGFAVLGMVLVHFHSYAHGFHGVPGHERTALEDAISWGVWLFVETKSAATFAFLFGVGFAIQLQRGRDRGSAFVPVYLRRLVVLGLFGLAAHALFGFNILLSYAYAGLFLLLMRNWSPRALAAAALMAAILPTVYAVSLRAIDSATLGSARAIAADAARTEERRARAVAVHTVLEGAEQQSSYAATVAARWQHMQWFYAQPFFLVPGPTLCLILLGVLAFRTGAIEAPRARLRAIAGFMAFGAVAWAVARADPPLWPADAPPPWIFAEVPAGFGLANEQWLAFTYVGGLLLLLDYRASLAPRLAPLAWVGRMALTNYLLQIAVLDLLFAGYGLDLDIRENVVLPATALLVSAEAILSRMWLARWRYGPAEWLWRSLAHGRLEPMVRPRPVASPPRAPV